MLWQRNKGAIATLVIGAVAVTAAAAGYLLEYRQEERQLELRAEALTGGSASRGELAFSAYGCGSCHSIRGMPMATGKIGPPLDGVGARAILAGRLENTPDNMMRWIAAPRQVDPQTAMPDLDVKASEARDISAFLYTLS